jgi:hypothetical protein
LPHKITKKFQSVAHWSHRSEKIKSAKKCCPLVTVANWSHPLYLLSVNLYKTFRVEEEKPHLTLELKLQIINLKEKNPGFSVRKVANLFEENSGRKVSRTTIYNIIKQKDKITASGNIFGPNLSDRVVRLKRYKKK